MKKGINKSILFYIASVLFFIASAIGFIRRQSLQTASDTKENLDDRAGNGKAAGIKKDRSILAGA